MTETADDDRWQFGATVRRARGQRTIRSVATAAGISEARWRQIERGYQTVGDGHRIPARPRRETVIAMARAVGIDVGVALEMLGMERDPENVGPSLDAQAFVRNVVNLGASGITDVELSELIRQSRKLAEINEALAAEILRRGGNESDDS